MVIKNDFQLFQAAGFAELLECISTAEAQANAANSFADFARREAKVAIQEALVIREVGESWLLRFDKALVAVAIPS